MNAALFLPGSSKEGYNMANLSFFGPLHLLLCPSFRKERDMTGKPNVEMQCGDAVVSIIADGEDIFIIADGMKIAKRGHPGTPQAKTWISLEPGWIVRDVGNGRGLEIEHKRARVH